MKYAETNEQPETMEGTIQMIEKLSEMMIKEKPHLEEEIKMRVGQMNKELMETYEMEIKSVPMEVMDYCFSSDLSEDEMLNEWKLIEYLKHLFNSGDLSFKKVGTEESVITINSKKLSEFGIFVNEVLPVKEVMELVGLTNARGIVK